MNGYLVLLQKSEYTVVARDLRPTARQHTLISNDLFHCVLGHQELLGGGPVFHGLTV